MGEQRYDLIDNFDLVGSVIEIGTDRGEGSTAYLLESCKKSGNKFYTIDFDIDTPSFPEANQHQMTGEEFFDNHFPTDEKICFAYLDGFDWIYESEDGYIPPWIPEQIKRYKTYGLEMNNKNSQLSHLVITKNVVKYAAEKCVIVFDDTFHTGSRYTGKGGTACPWLLEQKWHEIPTKKHLAKAFCNWDIALT